MGSEMCIRDSPMTAMREGGTSSFSISNAKKVNSELFEALRLHKLSYIKVLIFFRYLPKAYSRLLPYLPWVK